MRDVIARFLPISARINHRYHLLSTPRPMSQFNAAAAATLSSLRTERRGFISVRSNLAGARPNTNLIRAVHGHSNAVTRPNKLASDGAAIRWGGRGRGAGGGGQETRRAFLRPGPNLFQLKSVPLFLATDPNKRLETLSFLSLPSF